jgi:hypothetical protein
MPRAAPAAAAGRPLSEIVLKPRFIVAATCGLASYAMMNLLMTSAPLAMVMCNHFWPRKTEAVSSWPGVCS